MMIERCRQLLVLGVIVGALCSMAGTVRAQVDMGYCCVCSGCAGALSGAPLCTSVIATGTGDTACATLCTDTSCSSSALLEGACVLHASECFPRVHAPAVSPVALAGMAALLAGWGLQRVRKRRAS